MTTTSHRTIRKKWRKLESQLKIFLLALQVIYTLLLIWNLI